MKLFVISLLVACACGELVSIAERTSHSSKWEIDRVAFPDETLSFKILLKQQNLEKLEEIFWQVSEPKDPNYGKFLSKEDVAQLVAPDTESIRRVVDWLKATNLPMDFVLYPDYIHVSAPVSTAMTLFSTEFYVYTSRKTGNSLIRIYGTAGIPADLTKDIDFVVGISELIDDTRKTPRYGHGCRAVEADQYITPAILKSYYGIPPSQVGQSNKSSQGIAAFSDFFSLGALKAFDSNFAIPTPNVSREGPDCFNESCDQYESDLDIQYITAIAEHIQTLFLTHPNGQWILDWAQQIATRPNPPLINSISYGWSELEQCELTQDCSTYGYNSQQYVLRTDDELKKLGAMGITVLVSSGDDGAPSFYGASGNCPIDVKTYCPVGGCTHTTTQCAEFTVTYDANNTQCFIPMALTGDICPQFDNSSNFQNAIQAWAEANSAKNCAINIESDSDGNPHFFSSCVCSQLVTGTYEGFTVGPYVFNQSNGDIFSADYPTSSPYVTSVSATQFLWSGTTVTGEVAASITTQSRITTGGGFSSFQPQPSYQGAAVNGYLKSGITLPPSFSYNISNRAYPDISFNGHNYLVFASNNTNNYDTCPCQEIPVDGTSASSPSLAGLLALINDQLLSSGKSPLGFVNPALYDMAASNPGAFVDITSGSNRCNRAYCCEYGWTTAKGWDPVTGLGTPKFAAFSQYFLGAKGITSN